MSRHELKTWPEFFEPVLTGEKTFELRRDDRAFRAGDTLVLREWDRRDGYTGRKVERVVSYLLAGPAFGLGSDLVVMSLAAPQEEEARGYVDGMYHLTATEYDHALRRAYEDGRRATTGNPQ